MVLHKMYIIRIWKMLYLIEKLILSMTIDRVAGKSSLSKRNAIR